MHFPIAMSRVTKSLVNVSDVPNGKACNCYCADCDQNLIAANNGRIQEWHFRHESKDPNCSFNANYETYIHWLAKEIFKTLEHISLPAIRYNDISYDRNRYTELIKTLKIHIKNAGILESEYNSNQLNLLNIILQNSTTLSIDGWAIEQPVETIFGRIVVDVILQINKRQLFIEPYWTNPVSSDKTAKIASCNISTLAINLSSFVKKQFFSIEQFTVFLQKDISQKSWVFINTIKVEKLLSNLFNEQFTTKLEAKKKQVCNNRIVSKEINSKKFEINEKEIELIKLKEELEKLSINFLPINISDFFI